MKLKKNVDQPRVQCHARKCWHWVSQRQLRLSTGAEYFILKAEIRCLVPFTPPALCLPCEGIDRQSQILGHPCSSRVRRAIEGTDWNLRYFAFQPASHVCVSWCCTVAAKLQLRDSYVLETKTFSDHLSQRPSSGCLFKIKDTFFICIHFCFSDQC